MSAPATERCALCNESRIDHITGNMQRTPDKSIMAHYNCMLYSPLAIMIDSQDYVHGFDFNIETVQKEIERGKLLRCSLCKRSGATVGCEVSSCRKTYHFPCLINAHGSPSKEAYVVYCAGHKKKRIDNGSKEFEHEKKRKKTKKMKNHIQRKRKKLEKTAGKPREKSTKKLHNDENMVNVEGNEESNDNFLLTIDSALVIDEDEEAVPSTSRQCMSSETSSEESDSILAPKVNDVYSHSGFPKTKEKYSPNGKPNEKEAVPSTSARCLSSGTSSEESDSIPSPQVKVYSPSGIQKIKEKYSPNRKPNEKEDVLSTSNQHMSSGTSSEESDSILAPKMKDVYSLSGFPKTKKKYNPNRKPNEKLREILQTLSSQEKRNLSQIYSELGGSQPSTEMISPQDYQNETVTAEEDALNSDISHLNTSDSGEENKTPEKLPGISVHTDPLRCSSEEEHLTREKPVCSRDMELSNKTSTSYSKTERKNIDNMSTLDVSACSENSIAIPRSPELANGTTRTIMPSMTSIIGNRRVIDPVSLFKDIRLHTQQIHSPNSEENLSLQQVNCTDVSKSVRPDISVGSYLNVFNEQPAKNPGAQETSETHRSGYASVTEPESTFCSPLTLDKDGKKTEVHTSVSDVSLVELESHLPASQCINRDVPIASPSNEKRQNKGTISNIVTPEQISVISKKIGDLSKQFKTFVPQIQSTLTTPKRSTTKDTEQRYVQDISQGSPNSRKTDQPENAENYLHESLENQENSVNILTDDHITKKDPVHQEQSKSIKRKLCQEFEEASPNKRVHHKFGILDPPGMDLCAPMSEMGDSHKHLPTEENITEQLVAPGEQNKYITENATPGSVVSEHGSEHQSGPSSMATPVRRQLYGRFRNKRIRHQDGIDGFGEAVAGRCRLIPQERQTQYMMYALYSAELFRTAQSLPEFDTLMNNLRTVLDRS